MILVADFEVFAHDWILVAVDVTNETKYVLHNDPHKLLELYKQNYIWVFFNGRHYDQWILKGILAGFSAKEVNDWIIQQGRSGWAFSNLLHQYPILMYDAMVGFHGLKTLEAFQGKNIHETSVDFKTERKLTAKEIASTIDYCTNDVHETMRLLMKQKGDFDSHIAMIKEFNLPMMALGKTKAQLIAMVLGAQSKCFVDEFDFRVPPTLKLSKYQFIADWFLNLDKNEEIYNDKLVVDVAGIPHTFAFGGVHAGERYIGEGEFQMWDVASLYPSLMIKYGLCSRAMSSPEKYVEVYRKNLEMKKTGDPLRPIYKLICNTTYGCMGAPFNPLYDKLNQNLVCIFGQLLLLDLIEKLEGHCELVQSNTDGILIKLINGKRVDGIIKEWEQRTGLVMECTEYSRVYQADVNNYLIVDKNGKVKSKGAYVKKLNELDYDLPIVNLAIVENLVNNVEIEKTIHDCDDLIMFQKIYKVSSKYWKAWHNGQFLNEKVYRVFASKRESDTFLGKTKGLGCTIEKFANSPEHCYINNGDIRGMKVDGLLDKQWYINLAKKRLYEKWGL